tara:strand:- start:100 stop:468 length:369 start_codon:yes stop_codon:yes gene_type:complete
MKKLLYFLILIIFFLVISCGSNSDIEPILLGCTDSTAYNYNPLANVDDTSCIYCHECYIALYDEDGVEVGQLDLGEFCGDELNEIEAEGYQLTEVTVAETGDTLQPGLYTDVHCEEHGDHSH